MVNCFGILRRGTEQFRLEVEEEEEEKKNCWLGLIDVIKARKRNINEAFPPRFMLESLTERKMDTNAE